MAAHQLAVVEAFAVGAYGYAVGAHRDGVGGAVGVAFHQRASLNHRQEVRGLFGLRGGVIVEATPALFGGQVYHNDPIGALVRGVGYESRALLPASEVEAHIVEVGGRQGDVLGKEDIFFMTSSVSRSTHRSLGPPYSVNWNMGLPVSRI